MSTDGPGNPYVGLRPFESDEALIFFGRRTQVVSLLERLNGERFLAVIGSSGCGKSSLIRAGLIPTLEAGLLVAARERWRIATMMPGTSPRARLTAALADAVRADAQSLARAAAERGVSGLIDALAPGLAADDANLLVLVDQFEELFRYRALPAAGQTAGFDSGTSTAREESADFVSLLIGLAQQRELPLYVVITMRSDFLGDCDAFLGLPEVLNCSQYLVPRLTSGELREAILGPARLCGGDVAPRLVDRLLNDAGGGHDQLPVLQHALMRMWARVVEDGRGLLDLEDYGAIGTLAESLSQHAEEALQSLSPEQRRTARKMFQLLTDTDASNRRVRRPARIGEIERVTGASATELRDVIARFQVGGRAFLRVSGDPAGPDAIVDISHEALIRQWDTLEAWVDEEALDREQFLRLRDAAERQRTGRGGLLVDVDLRSAQAWWKRAQPTAAWAERYGGGFEAAERFLDASRRRRRAVAIGTWLGFGIVAAVIAFSAYETQRAKLDSVALNARIAESELRSEFERRQREEAQARVAELQILVRSAAAAYSPDRAEFANVTDDGVTVVRSAADRPTQVLAYTTGATSVAFSPDGRRIAVAVGAELQLWEYEEGEGYQRRWTSQAHALPVRKVAFSPNGALVATASEDRTCRVWEAATGAQVAELKGYQAPVIDVAFSPDGTNIYATSSVGEVLAWSSGKGSFQADDRVKRTVARAVVYPRIYVQIDDEGARAAVRAVGERLEPAGYVVPGVEKVDSVPAVTELRYFDASQEAGARDIVKRMAASGIEVVPKLVPGFEQSNMPAQQYELWFAHGEPQYWFPVVASVPEYRRALEAARSFQRKVGPDVDVDVYEAKDRRGERIYAVTLGGYMSQAEARTRLASPEAPSDAYAWEDEGWGGDLLPTPVADRVMRVIFDVFRIPAGRISMASRIGPDLGIPPDERTGLLRVLEEEFQVEIDDRAVANVQTVRQLAGVIEYLSRQPR